jgi:hypothetical protein
MNEYLNHGCNLFLVHLQRFIARAGFAPEAPAAVAQGAGDGFYDAGAVAFFAAQAAPE